MTCFSLSLSSPPNRAKQPSIRFSKKKLTERNNPTSLLLITPRAPPLPPKKCSFPELTQKEKSAIVYSFLIPPKKLKIKKSKKIELMRVGFEPTPITRPGDCKQSFVKCWIP